MKVKNVSKKCVAFLLALLLTAAQMPVARAYDQPVNSITWNCTGVKESNYSGKTTLEPNTDLVVSLEAEDNYVLPENAKVTAGVSTVGEYSIVSGDNGKTGTLTIPQNDINAGTLEITVTGEEAHIITWELTNINADPKNAVVKKDQQISTTFSVSKGYKLPNDVTVDGANSYTYEQSDGKLTVDWANIIGDVTITAEGVPEEYTVQADATSREFVTVDGDGGKAEFGSTVTFSVKSKGEGYTPAEVSATYGESNTAVESITGPTDGKYSFTMPAGNVTISVKWTLTGENYNVTTTVGENKLTPKDGWYAAMEAKVTPKSPATKIDTVKEGTYGGDSIEVNQGETKFYLKDDDSNTIPQEVTIKLDGTAPKIEIKIGEGALGENYNTLATSTLTPVITVTDSEGASECSGVNKAETKYVVIPKSDFEAIGDGNFVLTEGEIKSLEGLGKTWSTPADDGKCDLTGKSGEQVIIVKASDIAGNAAYKAAGMSCDTQPPRIKRVVVQSSEGEENNYRYNDILGVYDLNDKPTVPGESIKLEFYCEDDVENESIKPDVAPKIIAYRADTKEALATASAAGDTSYLTIGAWEWAKDEKDSKDSWSFNVVLKLEIDDGMVDGFYRFDVVLQDKAGNNNEGEPYKSPVFRLSRTAPGVEISYSGYTGYDDTDGYKTDGSVTENYEESEEEKSEKTSDKIFYINGEKTLRVGLSSGVDIIDAENWALAAKLNGDEDETELAKLTGVAVDKEKKEFKVDGSTAAEGTYQFTVTVTSSDRETSITFTVVVDKTDPAASEIVGESFTVGDDGLPVPGAEVKSGVWTNQENLKFTITGIEDNYDLLADCVDVPKGVTVETAFADGSWSGTISGEQNHKYKITITDKAGNVTKKIFTAKIDTTKVEDITVKARKDTTDMALITDQFTFGIFHVDYNKLAVTVEDPQPTDPGVYDGDEKVSQIREVQYHFVTNGEPEYKEFFAYYDEEGVKQYYSQAEVKIDTKARDTVQNNIQNYLASIVDKEDNSIWKTCVRDSIDNPNKVTTEAVAANKQYVVYFRVWDNANNMSSFFRNVIITDDESPVVSFAIDETAPAVVQANGTKIYTGAVPVMISVNEPNMDSDSFSGINKVTYTVYYGDQEVFTSGSFDSLPDADIPEKGSASAQPDSGLVEQGTGTSEKTIVLDDLDGKVIDAANIYIKVDVQDLSGNMTSYSSDGQVGFINIDKAPAEVKVEFDGNQLNGRYYGAQRSATITVTDNNFDPKTGIKMDTSGSIGSWKATELDGKGKTAYSAQIVFTDGQHHFNVEWVKDLAGHVTDTGDITYNAADRMNFNVDTIAPSAFITFARTDNKGFDQYNNSNVVMTVSVSETNFTAAGVALTVRRNGAAEPVGLSWQNHGGSHTASYTFSTEGEYRIGLTVTDLANHSDTAPEEYFTLDMTPPEIEIQKVKNLQAYNDTSVTPIVRVTDTNYDDLGVDITLMGVNGGEGYFDAETIANGEAFNFENVEDDDLYTLTVKAVDQAENESEMEIKFSVNRGGSVFTGDEVMVKAIEQGMPYFREDTLPAIRVFETNVDIIQSSKVYLTRDNINIDLTENVDYTITRQDVNGGWSQYVYEMNKDLFVEDGIYRISLVTQDAAGNAKNAESVVAFVVDNTLPILFVSDLEAGSIYNEEVKHVVFTPNDNLALSEIIVRINDNEVAKWSGEELTQMIRDGGEFGFDIPESDSRQNVTIILRDVAGNENESQLFENVLVSTNAFVRFYNNRPLFYGSIVAVVAAAGGIIFLVLKKKKKRRTSSEII